MLFSLQTVLLIQSLDWGIYYSFPVLTLSNQTNPQIVNSAVNTYINI